MFSPEVYTFEIVTRAKIFTKPVRRPKSVRRDHSADEWSEKFLATLGAWKVEIERPPQKPIKKSKDPFD